MSCRRRTCFSHVMYIRVKWTFTSWAPEKENPSFLFRLFYLPRKRELLFRTPHWRIDGIGLVHLQTAFLRILADGAPAVPLLMFNSMARRQGFFLSLWMKLPEYQLQQHQPAARPQRKNWVSFYKVYRISQLLPCPIPYQPLRGASCRASQNTPQTSSSQAINLAA